MDHQFRTIALNKAPEPIMFLNVLRAEADGVLLSHAAGQCLSFVQHNPSTGYRPPQTAARHAPRCSRPPHPPLGPAVQSRTAAKATHALPTPFSANQPEFSTTV